MRPYEGTPGKQTFSPSRFLPFHSKSHSSDPDPRPSHDPWSSDPLLSHRLDNPAVSSQSPVASSQTHTRPASRKKLPPCDDDHLDPAISPYLLDTDSPPVEDRFQWHDPGAACSGVLAGDRSEQAATARRSEYLFTDKQTSDTDMSKRCDVSNLDGIIDRGRGGGRSKALPGLQPLTNAGRVGPGATCPLKRIMAAPMPESHGSVL